MVIVEVKPRAPASCEKWLLLFDFVYWPQCRNHLEAPCFRKVIRLFVKSGHSGAPIVSERLTRVADALQREIRPREYLQDGLSIDFPRFRGTLVRLRILVGLFCASLWCSSRQITPIGAGFARIRGIYT